MRPFRLVRHILVLAVALGCAMDQSVAPNLGTPSTAIVDGNSPDGHWAFYWLPPIAPAGSPAPSGEFDAQARPTVRVCRLENGGCANDVASMPFGSKGAAGEYVQRDGDHFSARWITGRSGVAGNLYRLTVAHDGNDLGFADVLLHSPNEKNPPVPAGVVAARVGQPLTIEFIILKSMTIGASGGTITRTGVKLVVPPGAVTDPVNIAITLRNAPAAALALPAFVAGSVFDFTPDGQTFSPPATLTLAYNPANVPGGSTMESRLQMYHGVNGVWTLVPGSVVNTTAHTVSAPINGFSSYALAVPTITPLHGQLALGYDHGCGIATDAETWCWGHDRSFGSLGRGTVTNTIEGPGKIAGGHLFASITSGDPHTCGLLPNGVAMCWGRSAGGELGRGIPVGNNAAPAPVLNGPWTTISTGVLLSCATDLSNNAWCWGVYQRGNLGVPVNPPQGASFSPLPVPPTVPFQSVAAGWVHACGLSAGPSGNAYCWGNKGVLGFTVLDSIPPTLIPSPVSFTRLYAGAVHTCGLTATLDAYCWGLNLSGQLGDGTLQPRTTPTLVSGGIKFVTLATSPLTNPTVGADGVFTCGIANTGQAYCWGDNQFGQLGDGTTMMRTTPTPVATSQLFVSIATGRDFVCAMTSAREVYCWGSNAAGDLGSGVAGPNALTPVRVLPPF